MIVGMIIGAWIMVSLSLAVYGVFYSDKNDHSPVFIYPFELRIHFSDGDKVLTYNRCGKRGVLYRNFYIEKECYLFGMCIFSRWIPEKYIPDTCKEEYVSDIFIGTFEN